MNEQTQGWSSRAAELQKTLYYQVRDTGPRGLLKLAELVREPRETRHRRHLARRYLSNIPPPAIQMDSSKGYARVESGYFRDFDRVAAECERLFEIKRAKVAAETADMASWSQEQRERFQKAKRKFLRNLLNNEDLRRNPALVDFALHDDTLGLATSYLGTLPYLNRVDLLYSVPRDAGDKVASQLFHLDPEGLTQVKYFIHVFDVGDAEGPFTFIPADATRRILKEIRALRRTQHRPHVGRYTDEEIAAVGGSGEVVEIKGPRGAGVAIDTSRCLHLGSRVRPGAFRLCIYLQYCTTREVTNAFDIKRFKNDPFRYPAVKHSARTAVTSEVTAPHQMEA